MEGRWRRATLAAATLLTCAVLALSGCGGDSNADSGVVETDRPEVAFAPVVLLGPDEPWRPQSADWFIERSVLWFAEDRNCADRKVAVGHTLGEQRTEATDWIGQAPLGGVYWAYYRNPYHTRCEEDLDVRAYADQHVRLHDTQDRPSGLRLGQGFYLDLVDGQRPGPESLDDATAYFERADHGRGAVLLSYWMLFGMHGPAGRPAQTHEGDWERVDVLLRRDGEGRYEPRAVRIGALDAEGAPASPRDVPWRSVRVADESHPVLVAERGSHTLTPAGNGACADCTRWQTWRGLADIRKQPWHGFGGAWGEPGPTGATTGPLGPHGEWPDL